jgi:hypothetical protein
MRFLLPVCILVFSLVLTPTAVADEGADSSFVLPRQDGAIQVKCQEWPWRPGPRSIRALVHYPGGQLDRVNPDTGIMLTLHNWGGTDCVGTAAPGVLGQ